MEWHIGRIKSSKTGKEFIEKANSMAFSMGIQNYMIIAEGYVSFKGSPFKKTVEENAGEYRNEANLANCDFNDVVSNIDLERFGCFEMKRFFIDGVRINITENIPVISIVINGRAIAFLQFFKRDVRIYCVTDKGGMDMERFRVVIYSTLLNEVDWTTQFGVNGQLVSQILHHIAWTHDWRKEEDATAPKEVRACDLKRVDINPTFAELRKHTRLRSGLYDLNRIRPGLQVRVMDNIHMLEIISNEISVAFVRFEPDGIRIHPSDLDRTMDLSCSIQVDYESTIDDRSYATMMPVNDANLVRQVLTFIAAYEEWPYFGRGGK